jgi:hypothetical protein
VRNISQNMEKVVDQAARLTRKINLEGNSNSSSVGNSSMVGIDFLSNNFVFVDIVRDL